MAANHMDNDGDQNSENDPKNNVNCDESSNGQDPNETAIDDLNIQEG